MNLKLRRGQGAFILNGRLLPSDQNDGIVNGVIDFTTRPAEQQSMLSAYRPVVRTPLVAFGEPVTLTSSDAATTFTVTLSRPHYTGAEIAFDWSITGGNQTLYTVRVYGCRETLRASNNPHGVTGSVIDITGATGTSGLVPALSTSYEYEYFLMAHVVTISNGAQGRNVEVGTSYASQVTGAVIYSSYLVV